MNKKENKLKLRENEVVHCEAFMLAAQVCELADGLNARWGDSVSYIKKVNYSTYKETTCYDLNKGLYCERSSYERGDVAIITAVEWLNRHDIFVYGQEVICRGSDKRIYIAPHVAVMVQDEKAFKSHNAFRTATWSDIKSTFPAWPPEPVKRRLKLDLEVSQEQYDAIKASLGEGS